MFLFLLQKADIAVAMITATAERSKKVNFVTPFYRLETSFAIPSSEVYDQNFLLRPFQPFDLFVWQAAFGSLILLMLIYQILQHFNHASDNIKPTFIENCTTCFKIVLRQSKYYMFCVLKKKIHLKIFKATFTSFV